MSNVEAVVSAQEAKEQSEKEFEHRISSIKIKHMVEMTEAEHKLHGANKKYRRLFKKAADKEAASYFTDFFILLCCSFQSFAFIEDLLILISALSIRMQEFLSSYADWLYAPYDERTYDDPANMFYATCSAWILRILTVLLFGFCIVLISKLIVSLVQCYIKNLCPLFLRITYCTLIMLLVTPLAQVVPFNSAFIFCTIHILSLVIIRIMDMQHKHDSRQSKWSYIKSL